MASFIHYRSSRAKLDWCHAQLDILAREIAEIVEEHRQVSMFEADPECEGMFEIKPDEFIEVPDRLSVQAGRIIGAVRSALDNLVVQTVEIASPESNSRHVVFPISGNPEEPGSHEWMANKIGGLPEAYRNILTSFHPYKGGNDALLSLHELRKQDEHLSVNIALVKRSADLRMETVWATVPQEGAGDGGPFVLTAIGFKPHFNTAVSVCFGEGTSAEGREVVPTIAGFIELANGIVAQFENVTT